MGLAESTDALASRVATEVKAVAGRVTALETTTNASELKYAAGTVVAWAVYVTDDWLTDPANPANGGTLPAGVPVLEY